MKRQMINYEQLPFPSGIAAATTLKSLYSKSQEAIHQAYALLGALAVGALTGVAGKGDYAWQHAIKFKLPELIPFVSTGTLSKFPGFGFEPSALLIGAGMIVGMRVSLSMLIGSLILYLVVGPMMVEAHEIPEPAKLLKWSLWTGTALMVTSGLAAFALQWKTILRALGGVKSSGSSDSTSSELDAIEVPRKWFIVGVTILTIAMALLQYLAFSISLPLGVLAVVMSFFLALVACRSTGETDITPIGPMGKLTQLTYGVLAPSNVTTNLMAASVTANTASSSADLLTDLKSGYLLGANPKQQFLAQCAGVFFGTVAVVPAWYAMVRTPEALEAMNPPSTNMWKAVAEAMAGGLQNLPPSAQIGIAIGASLGLILALLDHFAPQTKRFLPSAMGLGLSWVMPFANCFSFFLGALIAMIWSKVNEKNAETFVVPTASGAVAGESLACAIIAIINAGAALAK